MYTLVLVAIPVAVTVAACLVRRGGAITSLVAVVVLVSLGSWFFLQLGCGNENNSAQFYARCDQAYPMLPLLGVAVVMIGAALGWATRSHLLARGALAMGLVPSVVAWVGLSV